jgi:hypothetical protein
MARRGEGFTLPRSLEGCLGFIILGAIILACGAKATLLVAALCTLGGFGSLADRRRNAFAGLGMIAFGLALAIGGLMISGGNNPFEFPPVKPAAEVKDAPKKEP